MKRICSYITLLAAALTIASCVANDLPDPVIKGAFASLDVAGAREVIIDEQNAIVTISLPEEVDPAAVTIRSATYVHPETRCEPQIEGVWDLSAPQKVTLKTYQDYPWTIRATQDIERYFTVQGQVGSTVIDAPNRRVIAYVSAKESIRNITVTSLKLGPVDVTTISPSLSALKDFSQGVLVEVSYRGRTEVWSLYVEQTEFAVDLSLVDPWTTKARVVAQGSADAANSFRYRKEGEQEWMEADEVTQDGGLFYAFIGPLEPVTRYECVARSGSDESAPVVFETESAAQLPNAGFEAYSNAESANFFSWYDPSSSDPLHNSKWWDSGNVGSTTLGSSYCIAQPDTEERVQGRASAQLVSRYVVIKFAAGNTFSGEFVRIVGTQGGVLNFGRPWTLRPSAIRLWAKYECGEIDVIDSYPDDYPVNKGDADCCQIWLALGDWDYKKYGGTSQCPVQVNTTDKSTFFTKDDDSVIAYGDFTANTSSEAWPGKPQVIQTGENGWMQLEIPIEYKDVSRRPTHIIVSFAASRLGDYFTGSSKSRMWIDDVEMVY